MTTATKTGRFVWHETMSTDVKKSAAFYSELFGWKIKEIDMGPMGTYRIFSAGTTDVGGAMQVEEGHGTPSHWLGYVSVEDVDAADRRIKAAGGKILVPPTDIPSIGRFSIFTDPQGGAVATFHTSDERTEPEGRPAPGTFCWDELLTTDPAAAAKFYQAVFGWESKVAKDMGPMGTYNLWKRGEKNIGGMMKPPPGAPQQTHWVHYVAVESTDGCVKRVETLGGKVLSPAHDIPNVGRFAVLGDSTGASFAVLQGTPA